MNHYSRLWNVRMFLFCLFFSRSVIFLLFSLFVSSEQWRWCYGIIFMFVWNYVAINLWILAIRSQWPQTTKIQSAHTGADWISKKLRLQPHAVADTDKQALRQTAADGWWWRLRVKGADNKYGFENVSKKKKKKSAHMWNEISKRHSQLKYSCNPGHAMSNMKLSGDKLLTNTSK